MFTGEALSAGWELSVDSSMGDSVAVAGAVPIGDQPQGTLAPSRDWWEWLRDAAETVALFYAIWSVPVTPTGAWKVVH